MGRRDSERGQADAQAGKQRNPNLSQDSKWKIAQQAEVQASKSNDPKVKDYHKGVAREMRRNR